MKDLENLLSKKDVVCLLELIHSSLSCSSEEELRKLIGRLKYLIPFKFTLCGLGKINSDCTVNSYNILNISYPSEWLELYVSQRFDKIDPIVKENCLNFRLQYWADTYTKHGSPKEFISHAEDVGMRAGYTYGLRNFNGNEGSLFSFAGDSIEHHPRTEIILEYFIPHFHQALTRILHQHQTCSTLSLREKEVLKWLKEGKSTWEISVILYISQNTIKFHVRNIMQKLNAVKRSQAVAIAIEQGLIDIE
ncbi:MAG TPA: autoinducer binding domain-containing protein [Thermodesulfovibrionia bacterium]|nr:autoinducer binding domain-containing protein [Thermodesulfovibrionia bacterium]